MFQPASVFNFSLSHTSCVKVTNKTPLHLPSQFILVVEHELTKDESFLLANDHEEML